MPSRLSPAALRAALAIVIACVAAVASAQDAGVKGGGNFASLNISTVDGNIYTGRLHVGVAGGGFVVFPVTKSLIFETDVLVETKGTRDGNEHINLTYLDVPVLVRFVNYATRHSQLHAYMGPSFAFKLSSSDNLSPLSLRIFGNHPVADATKTFDPGFTIGGDVMSGHLLGDFRYTWGATNIGNSLTPSSGTINNRALTIMIGYRIRKD